MKFNGATLIAIAIAAITTGTSAAAQEETRTVKWEKYVLEGPAGARTDAHLGTLMVPENRARPGSRLIPLKFVRLPSTAGRPGNPIVYLAGGPGGSAVRNGQGARYEFFQKLRSVSDVILLDQRGTGLSNTLPECKVRLFDPSRPIDRSNLVENYRAELQRCIGFWRSRGVDPNGYTTVQNALDLESLRAAIGAERLNLVGLSYGTHLGMAGLKQNIPVERVVFSGLEGLDQTVKRPSHIDAFLKRVARLVAADTDAGAAYPDLLGLMRRVHGRLDAEPALVTIPGPGGTADRSVRLGSFGIQLLASLLLISDPDGLVRLPGYYARLDSGDYAAAATVLVEALEGEFGVFNGMPQLMDLASGISAERLAQSVQEAKVAVLGDSVNFPMPHIHDVAPDIVLTDSFRTPLNTDVPALLIMSTLDGRTPIESQEEILPQFARARRLTVENGGHNIWEQSEAVQGEVVRFLSSGTTSVTKISLPTPDFVVRKAN